VEDVMVEKIVDVPSQIIEQGLDLGLLLEL
jgi:hypothetical protein